MEKGAKYIDSAKATVEVLKGNSYNMQTGYIGSVTHKHQKISQTHSTSVSTMTSYTNHSPQILDPLT